jgi:GNAT superfamily N-acetyltransferase
MIVILRPETSSDRVFVRRLILETIEEDLGAGTWPEPMRSQLLEIQYGARRQSNSPAAESRIIQADTSDAGWVLAIPLPSCITIVDIMILSGLRGRGIGSEAIRRILAAATAENKPVRLHVNVINRRAIALYERLGFRKVGSNEVQQLMEYGTDSAASC